MKSDRYISALNFAKVKHDGQYRIGGDPYITHPLAVAHMLEEWGCDEEYQITGLFHDLLEDTDATENEIREIGGDNILDKVRLLTKYPGFNMEEYVSKIKADPFAKAVKIADRIHNLRSAVAADRSFQERYIKDTLKWYIDFSPEIIDEVKHLAGFIGMDLFF